VPFFQERLHDSKTKAAAAATDKRYLLYAHFY
jgi:hypothetical protein